MISINAACLVIREASPLGQQYYCRALGDFAISAREPLLSSAIQEVKKVSRRSIEEIAKSRLETKLTQWVYDPDWISSTVELFLKLPDRTLKVRVPLLLKPFGTNLLVQSPLMPGFSFLLARQKDLEKMASERMPIWITAHERWRELDWSYLLIPRDHWIEQFELEFEPGTLDTNPMKKFFSLLMKRQKMDGAQHLQAIGRCLDDEVQESQSIYGRLAEINQLEKLLDSRQRQSVALIGPTGAGKSAIIQEVVRQRAKRKGKRVRTGRVWAINTQRIVSGMMYLGQWEERWLSILKEIHKRDHVLLVEDPLGLLTAGKTRDSKMTAGDVLVAFAAVHPIRLVTEMTSQAYGILKLRKRELADLFLSIPVESLTHDETLELLIRRTGELEVQRQRFFHVGTLPLMISSTERYLRGEAFPGKTIQLLDDLGRQRHEGIGGKELMTSLQQRTGLKLTQRMSNISEFERELKSKVIGQDTALEKLSQFLSRARAGIQPDDRPLGVFLCVGPTGVGKTETAKAIAQVMYSGEQQLLRFDMNEINSPLAAEQLIGSYDQPDGKLTSAVRRQPHAVILLDEIEKAHPDVFDYLLQVIGEGRMTDAIGRTIDFRDTLILMTSNIGVREASQAIGFDSSDQHAADYYRRAAAAFFRPEFMNRLDGILAFRPLTRVELGEVAELQLSRLLARDGVRRRKICLAIEKDAKEWLVGRGYDPQLGARILKRELEKFLAQPLADALAERFDHSHLLIHVHRQGSGISSRTVPLPLKKKRVVKLPEAAKFVEVWKNEIDELDQKSELLRERCDFAQSLSSEVTQYYALREELKSCRDLYYQLKESIEQRGTSGASPRIDTNLRGPRGRSMKMKEMSGDKLYFDDQRAADAIREVAEADIETAKKQSIEILRWSLATELEYAKVMYESFGQEDEVTFYVRCLTSQREGRVEADWYWHKLPERLRSIVVGALGYDLQMEVFWLKDNGVLERPKLTSQAAHLGGEYVLAGIMRGVGAQRIARAIAGLYVVKNYGTLYRLGILKGNPLSIDTEQMPTAFGEIEGIWHDMLLNIDHDLSLNQQELRGEITVDCDVEIENSDGLSLKPLVGEEDEKDVYWSSEESGRRVFLEWLLLDRVGAEVNDE